MAINGCDDLEVVAEGIDCASGAKHIRTHTPAALVLDITLPDGEGLDLLETCRLHSPHTKTLVLSAHSTRAWANRALNAGCAGYLDKSVGMDEIAPAVRSILRGRTIVSIPTIDELVEEIMTSEPPRQGSSQLLDPDILTVRENQVLGHIAVGLTNQQTADAMFLSVKTVETYRSRLMKKLDLRGRSELFEYALAQGLVGPGA